MVINKVIAASRGQFENDIEFMGADGGSVKNLATPTADTDAVNKTYADNLITTMTEETIGGEY